MVGIELPDEDRLPAGPARVLVVALHGLYRGAGFPGLRRIAKAITKGDFTDTVSHETVSDMLNGKSVPRWSKLECVVRQLAIWNPTHPDPDEMATRFQRLWEAAAGGVPGPLPQPTPSSPGTASQLAPGSDTHDPGMFPYGSPPGAGGGGGMFVTDAGGIGRALADGPSSPQGRGGREWAQARHALIAGLSRWGEPADDGQTAQVRHLRENQSSHPTLSARSQLQDRPPAVRIGVRVACNPLPVARPTSSAVRGSFLQLLSRGSLAALVDALTAGHGGWEKWGGHGRSDHEAILASMDNEAEPVAWARLLLPEPRMAVGWRDSHSALLVLHIDRLQPQTADGPHALPPIPFLDWQIRFEKALECPWALAGFLVEDLGLDVPMEDPTALVIPEIPDFDPYGPVASVAVWLITPQAMTSLVDISGYQRLPGSPVTPQFGAYAVTHMTGPAGPQMAIEWMRQMCDYTLHLDDCDSPLLVFGEQEGGVPSGGVSNRP